MLQGYIAHKKLPPPPIGALFLMSDVPLYGTAKMPNFTLKVAHKLNLISHYHLTESIYQPVLESQFPHKTVNSVF